MGCLTYSAPACMRRCVVRWLMGSDKGAYLDSIFGTPFARARQLTMGHSGKATP